MAEYVDEPRHDVTIVLQRNPVQGKRVLNDLPACIGNALPKTLPGTCLEQLQRRDRLPHHAGTNPWLAGVGHVPIVAGGMQFEPETTALFLRSTKASG